MDQKAKTHAICESIKHPTLPTLPTPPVGVSSVGCAVDIQQELRRHLRQADVPTIKALTMALKAQGFHHGAWVGQRGWYARRRSEE